MFHFERKKFWDGFRLRLDETIEQEQVDGLEFLLTQIESDPIWKSIPEISYALATVFHETAGSFQPVEEGYYLGRGAKAFQKKLRYYPWFGRGYVQLTWLKNYKLAKSKTGVDLVADPSKALDPEVAYQVLAIGMHEGWFTTKKLSDFISSRSVNYVDARTIINGHDKAGLIAGYARSFEKILGAASGTAQVGEEDPATGTDIGTGTDPVPLQKPDKPPPEPQVIYKEKASAWSKVWAGVCAFFSFLWATVTGWYTTDFARPLIDKARDNAADHLTPDLLPQILLLLLAVAGIGVITVLFLWLGVWVWNHEKARVNDLNKEKLAAASQPDTATVEFTTNAKQTTAYLAGGTDELLHQQGS